LVSLRPFGQLPAFAKLLPGVNPNLVQLEQAADRFRVALPREIEQPASLIQFFFFCMGACPPFHPVPFLSIPGGFWPANQLRIIYAEPAFCHGVYVRPWMAVLNHQARDSRRAISN
jgi:hypothetical protein